MKLNKKIIAPLAVLLVAPALLLACSGTNGNGEEGNVPEEFKGLKFTATEDGSSVSYSIPNGTVDTSGIQYSLDDGTTWETWAGTSISLNNNESVCVKNSNNTLSSNSSNYLKFAMTGKIAASGDISSMINNAGLSKGCYIGMFSNCSALITAPSLPATILAESCYEGMFSACSALITAPNLPANTLMRACYSAMFTSCDSLTSTPTLPAAELADACYSSMFAGCTSLASASLLPAAELKNNCYGSMFAGCSNLKIEEDNPTGTTKIFKCPDTSTTTNPVQGMFSGCVGGSFKSGTPTAGKTYYYI